MLRSRTKWKIDESKKSEERIIEIANALGCSSFFVSLCFQRGLDTEEKIKNFIHPTQDSVHDPFLMKDMEKAVERIMTAIENGDLITVYGDYDADGVTSTTLLIETIEMIGGSVQFYIPDRFVDGYGPNTKAFESLIESGTKLILTCDNGVSGHEAIKRANELGVDVIVTDHHELSEPLPDAYALVHPRHPQGRYPFGDLSGAGVAFKLATALLGEVPVELLDLVAIGTVADLVSLTGENRTLVIQGIKALKVSGRTGLSALFKRANIKQNEIDEETIGFILGPRLNALGRLGDASPAVQLLRTFDEEEAAGLADLIEEKNSERQAIVSKITEEAFKMIEESDQEAPHVYVLAKVGWHEGVLGIVASKIVRKTGKPAIVLSIDDHTGAAKGSGRSVSAYPLYHAISDSKELMTSFGGHHMAAGLTLPAEKIGELQKELNLYAVREGLADDLSEETEIHEKLKLEDINLQYIEELQQLAPFGTDNPKPVFLLENMTVKELRRIGSDQAHLKMKLHSNDHFIDVIGFQFGQTAEEIGYGAVVSLVGKLSINEWNGLRKPQFMMEDISADGVQLFDMRSSKIQPSLFQVSQSDYIFFDQKIAHDYRKKIPADSFSCLITEKEDAESFLPQTNQLVLVDCPPNIDLLKLVLKRSEPSKMTICFFSRENAYLDGMPDRTQFAKTFKYMLSHQAIDVRHKLDVLAGHLDIKKSFLVFMILVFLEMGFVTIKDGIMNVVKDAPKKKITDAVAYQKRTEKIKTEEFLIYSHFGKLEPWIREQLNKL